MSDALPPAIAHIDSALARRADSLGVLFRTRGVAIDHTVAAGMQFLSRLRHVDEIAAGRNWMNAGAVELLWRDHFGRAALPQVIILQRHVAVTSSTIKVSPDTVMLRVVGVDSIQDWARRGAPLPLFLGR